MPFITQGKANIKYLLIVVFVAAVAGGIIFICWNGYRKEIANLNNFTEIKKTEKSINSDTANWNLENAEYYINNEMVKLENGQYFKAFPGLAEGLDVRIYKDKIAFGDLNNDNKKDAAVVLTVNEGGSGDFRSLAIMLDKGNEPVHLTSIGLGDRTIINSIDIQSGIITLDMVIQGPNDGMCCPTLHKIFKYKLSENKLVEI